MLYKKYDFFWFLLFLINSLTRQDLDDFIPMTRLPPNLPQYLNSVVDHYHISNITMLEYT